jgi:PAS domain S-box-containing protein
MRILIVDDRMENRYLLETVLKSEAHDTVSAENGQKALECLASGSFDLIISDILMPVMDGFQLCRHCKADPILGHIPFVFYTATYVDQKDEAFAYEIGADGFLKKGMEPADFLTAIHSVIKNLGQGRPSPKSPVKKPEEETYKHYSERLVQKLDQKMQDLKEKEERLNMALEASSDGLWDWNVQTGEIYFSPRYYTMLGYKPYELPQAYDTWVGLLHPDDRKTAEKTILDHIEKKSGPYEQEFRLKTRSGKWKWILGKGKVFSVDENGRPLRVVGTHTDISRLKAAVRQARETQKELKIRNQIAHIFLTTPGDDIYEKILALVLDMTQSRYGIFGFIDDAGEWVCPSLTKDIWENCQVPDKRIAFPHDTWTGIWGQAMTDKTCRYINQRLHLPKGHITIDNALDAPVVYQDRLVGNLLIGQKDTGYTDDDQRLMEMVADQIAPVLKTRLERDREQKERKLAEIRLQQVQKLEAIGSLAGGIAHDFNNILSAILGYAQLAMDRLPEGSPAQADLEQIYKGGERAKDLVMQILAFSRQQKQNAVPIQISSIIKEVLKFLKSTLPSSIEIRQQIVPDAGIVMADPTWIHQILMNLCTNAAHAMDKTGGILTVTLFNMTLDLDMIAALPDLVPGKYLKLTVGDTGHGIPPDILPKIFDPYFTTKKRGEGTGLGLATVHGIMKSCNGGITASSQPGQGTTFQLYFPIIETPNDIETDSPPFPVATTLKDARILVVDDEPPIAKMGKQILELMGYQAEACTDPLDALARIKDDPNQFDLVITDLTMPGMKGDQLAMELMKIRPDLPVILCSGFSMNMSQKQADAAGIKAFLSKPILKNKLAAVVRDVLAESRSK